MTASLSGRAACGLLVAAALALSCSREQWHVGRHVRAQDEDVAAALGDTAQQITDDLRPSDIPAIEYPRALRPCCAFGTDLRVELGRVAVPGVEIGNLIDPKDLGHHRYDNGYLSVQRDPRGLVADERSGLVYTCRAGFLDIAHVRDNADNTLALTSAIARTMETGSTTEIPPQGAVMRVRVQPISPEAIAKYGRKQLAGALAQWLAFQLSIWHEIATFYGYASLADWPEKISAFSPEDLYSNQIGVRIAAGIVAGAGARSDLEYGVNFDAWLARTLERLGAVPLASSRAAMREVDGAWWDSDKRIPDWTLVKRRNFVTGPFLHGWRLEDARPGTRGAVTPLARCKDAAPPLVLYVADGFAGARFRDHATVELEVGDALVAGGFPLPRADSRLVTQDDFPAIVERIRQANAQQFGEGADAP